MNLMNSLMLSCVKATQLMELKEHASLGLIKSFQLQMHTAMCSGCRNYMKQTKLVDELLRRNFAVPASVEDTEELEATIIANIV